MSEIFILIIFGHIIGDYILQPAWMATKKGSSNLICIIHCLIVMCCIVLWTTTDWRWALFTFTSHFIIDRFSLADVWLKLIKGRALTEFIQTGHKGIDGLALCKSPLETLQYEQANGYMHSKIRERQLNYRILRGSFSGIVYVIIDASFHLIPAYYFYKYFIL